MLLMTATDAAQKQVFARLCCLESKSTSLGGYRRKRERSERRTKKRKRESKPGRERGLEGRGKPVENLSDHQSLMRLCPFPLLSLIEALTHHNKYNNEKTPKIKITGARSLGKRRERLQNDGARAAACRGGGC